MSQLIPTNFTVFWVQICEGPASRTTFRALDDWRPSRPAFYGSPPRVLGQIMGYARRLVAKFLVHRRQVHLSANAIALLIFHQLRTLLSHPSATVSCVNIGPGRTSTPRCPHNADMQSRTSYDDQSNALANIVDTYAKRSRQKITDVLGDIRRRHGTKYVNLRTRRRYLLLSARRDKSKAWSHRALAD
ncbi:hypothetical protein B0H11DRAFT_1912609 [Mycena galericulata]|nr:hypothetical protein B0H11DRAFT_1912609 [Mycena galericulata]